jgi:RNA polymerase sigma factor (sigma-70 family)
MNAARSGVGMDVCAVVQRSAEELGRAMERPVERNRQFQDVYEAEYVHQVRRAGLLVGDGDAAHDIVQDSFAELLSRWADVANPGGYLNRSVVNRCRDHTRRRRRAQRNLRTAATPAGVPPEADPLWDVLVGLPFNQRAVVVLRFYGDLTEAEIAEALGCPTGSVGPWLRRALDRMRKELE